MRFDLATEFIVSIICGGLTLIAILYTRIIKGENTYIKSDIDGIKKDNENIWTAIEKQETLSHQSREEIIRLTSSIDRLNEILNGIKQLLDKNVSLQQCEVYRSNDASYFKNKK